jgi:hypothetical protein
MRPSDPVRKVSVSNRGPSTEHPNATVRFYSVLLPIRTVATAARGMFSIAAEPLDAIQIRCCVC